MPATSYETPYDEEMERGVIGSVLINPSLFIILFDVLKPTDFFLVRHQHIWEAMIRIDSRDEVIERQTLRRELQNANHYTLIGGDTYLSELINSTPSAIYAEQYAQLVQRDSVRRKLIQAADDIKAIAYDKSRDIDTALSDSERKLSQITDNTHIGHNYKTMSELSHIAISETEIRIANKGEPIGIPTGYTKVDTILNGSKDGDLVIIAGRPGMGKTAFAINMSLNAARNGTSVAHFTIEMSAESIHYRRLAIETGLPIQKLTGNSFTDRELSRYMAGAGSLSKLPIYTDDSKSLTPTKLRSTAMRVKGQHGLDMIIVDYIGLMSAPGYERNRVQEVSYITRYLKQLAGELEIPVFALAQLNRKVEERSDKRPLLSDLRDSGSIEQDADAVMFLYRDVVYNEATENPNQADVIVAKHRNGATGTAPLYFHAPLMQFSNGSVQSVDLSTL